MTFPLVRNGLPWLAWALLITGCAVSPRQRAHDLVTRGDYLGAARILRQALADKQGDAELSQQLAATVHVGIEVALRSSAEALAAGRLTSARRTAVEAQELAPAAASLQQRIAEADATITALRARVDSAHGAARRDGPVAVGLQALRTAVASAEDAEAARLLDLLETWCNDVAQLEERLARGHLTEVEALARTLANGNASEYVAGKLRTAHQRRDRLKAELTACGRLLDEGKLQEAQTRLTRSDVDIRAAGYADQVKEHAALGELTNHLQAAHDALGRGRFADCEARLQQANRNRATQSASALAGDLRLAVEALDAKLTAVEAAVAAADWTGAGQQHASLATELQDSQQPTFLQRGETARQRIVKAIVDLGYADLRRLDVASAAGHLEALRSLGAGGDGDIVELERQHRRVANAAEALAAGRSALAERPDRAVALFEQALQTPLGGDVVAAAMRQSVEEDVGKRIATPEPAAADKSALHARWQTTTAATELMTWLVGRSSGEISELATRANDVAASSRQSLAFCLLQEATTLLEQSPWERCALATALCDLASQLASSEDVLKLRNHAAALAAHKLRLHVVARCRGPRNDAECGFADLLLEHLRRAIADRGIPATLHDEESVWAHSVTDALEAVGWPPAKAAELARDVPACYLEMESRAHCRESGREAARKVESERILSEFGNPAYVSAKATVEDLQTRTTLAEQNAQASQARAEQAGRRHSAADARARETENQVQPLLARRSSLAEQVDTLNGQIPEAEERVRRAERDYERDRQQNGLAGILVQALLGDLRAANQALADLRQNRANATSDLNDINSQLGPAQRATQDARAEQSRAAQATRDAQQATETAWADAQAQARQLAAARARLQSTEPHTYEAYKYEERTVAAKAEAIVSWRSGNPLTPGAVWRTVSVRDQSSDLIRTNVDRRDRKRTNPDPEDADPCWQLQERLIDDVVKKAVKELLPTIPDNREQWRQVGDSEPLDMQLEARILASDLRLSPDLTGVLRSKSIVPTRRD